MTDQKQVKDTYSENEDSLWNENELEINNEQYNAMMIEQYKIHAEMSDRISSRRTLANVFFLTLHALLLSALGLSLINNPSVSEPILLLCPLLGLLLLCYAWWRIVQYYRRQFRGRSSVIEEIEKRLPCRLTRQSQKEAFASPRAYNSIKRMESIVPILFTLLYITCYAYAVW